jgi:beta-mannosidase
MVINHRPEPLAGAKVHVAVYNLDGTIASENDVNAKADPSAAADLGPVVLPNPVSPVHFVKLRLQDAAGKLISENFYWQAPADQPDNLQDLDQLPAVTLKAKVARREAHGKCLLEVTLQNPTSHIALMTHLQLRRQHSGERVLPVYYSDNYVSLLPQESKTITIEAAQSDLNGDAPLVVMDGWNVAVAPSSTGKVAVALNEDAQVSHWPATGLPIVLPANQ